MKTNWDLSHLYMSQEDWDKDFKLLSNKIEYFNDINFEVNDENIILILNKISELDILVERLYCYQKRIVDLDIDNKDVKEKVNKAKMSDAEIITIYLLIQCLGKSINKGYNFLKNNFPELVNYIERSRFNRLVNSLMTVIRAIRRHFMKFKHSVYKIVDSFPLTTSKFGRGFFLNYLKALHPMDIVPVKRKNTLDSRFMS